MPAFTCHDMHSGENTLLRSLPARLRLMQRGEGERVPDELRQLPFVQMGKIADWIEREIAALDREEAAQKRTREAGNYGDLF
jgi:hypothetical protein